MTIVEDHLRAQQGAAFGQDHATVKALCVDNTGKTSRTAQTLMSSRPASSLATPRLVDFGIHRTPNTLRLHNIRYADRVMHTLKEGVSVLAF